MPFMYLLLLDLLELVVGLGSSLALRTCILK